MHSIRHLRKALTVSTNYYRPTYMTEEEIQNAINKVEGLGGMTVNERLFVSGITDEFDNALKNDKDKARRILEMLHVDKGSIDKIVN